MKNNVELARRWRAGIALFVLCVAFPLRVSAFLDDDELIARLDVCFDFGCKSGQQVEIYESDWRAVRALLTQSQSAQQERVHIATAIAMMESIVSVVSPTGVDRAGNDIPGQDFRGQMDCIDESNNATTYLRLFQDRGLLRWHEVRERVYRAPLIIDEHWAAQIEELSSGDRFAVDSWPRAHAMPAVIQPLAHWRAKRDSVEMAAHSVRH
jgi:hypothetical protein